LWRPFLEQENAPPLLVPVLPGIHGWINDLPLGLCVLAAASENDMAQLPPGDILSPVLLAAAARGVYDLIASPDRAQPVFPRIAKALRQNARWQRRGIYLYIKQETPDWDTLFRQFLDGGFLIPPVPSQPLILPGVLSPGEEAKLAALLSVPQTVSLSQT
jgi:hypothetical protein